jgi:hypothetical protein
VYADFQSKPRPGGLSEFFHESRSSKVNELIDRTIQKRLSSSSAREERFAEAAVAAPPAFNVNAVSALLSTVDSLMHRQ